MRWWVLLAAAPLAAAGCPENKRDLATVSSAHQVVAAAAKAKDAATLYECLDTKTRWSLMSVLRAKREIRQLVRKHYPRARQGRELRRTRLAGRANNDAEYFAALAGGLWEKIPVGPSHKVKREGERSVVVTKKGELPFCREEGQWRYCGLREHFEQLKLRVSRDLELVRENAEAFRKGG